MRQPQPVRHQPGGFTCHLACRPSQRSQPPARRIVCLSQRIELIVTDVDGTLLNPQQELTPGVQAALHAAAAVGVPVVVATGKAVGPWTRDVLPRLGSSMPQVYLQGLLILDADGSDIYSRQLEADVIHDAIAFARAHALSLVAYCGDRIVAEATDEHTDRLIFYKEPTPEGIGPLEAAVGVLPIMKLIFMQEHERVSGLRPQVAALFEGRASLTTAIPGMLEVLPLGASKGAGVAMLLERLGVAPERCMALGDGENDVEMLKLCGLGVAVGNAGEAARAVADVVVAPNDKDGVAEAIQRFVLEPRGAAL